MLGRKDGVAVFHATAHHVMVVGPAVKERHFWRAPAPVHRDYQGDAACRVFGRDVDSLGMYTRQDRDYRTVVNAEAVFPDLCEARLLFWIGSAKRRIANALGKALFEAATRSL